MTCFNTNKFDATKQPMFFGEPVNVARYDVQKYPIFEKLIEKQLSFFWRPEEVDLSRDQRDFVSLSDSEKHMFLSNLKYQTLLDSVQGRSPNLAFLPIVSIPELETWVELWSAFEGIHSRSYTHIIRNLVNDPSVIFDSIIETQEILDRAGSVTKYYDILIDMNNEYCMYDFPVARAHKKALLLCMMAVNVLEAIRFYVSFACSFSFAERSLMEGNSKIIRLVSRDEQLHLVGTQEIIKNLIREDTDYAEIFEESQEEFLDIFREAAEEESDWCDYLFKEGPVLGLNSEMLKGYVRYLTNERTSALGLPSIFEEAANPLPWMDSWLKSDNVQVAPQETEISSYLVGAVDSNIEEGAFGTFEL